MNSRSIVYSLNSYRDEIGDEIVDLLVPYYEALGKLSYPLEWEPSDKEAMVHALENDKPVLSVEEPLCDRTWFIESLRPVLTALGSDADTFALARIEQEDLAHLLTHPFEVLERLTDKLGLDEADPKTHHFHLAFSGVTSVFGEAVHEAVDPIIKGAHFQGPTHCPVCGNPPTLGVIADGSKLQGSPKTLWCSVCHTTWRFARIRCELCGQSNQYTLHYVYEEEDQAHKIHVCEKCGGSLPVVDEGELHDIAEPLVEELVMIPLHNAVIENGFENFVSAQQQALDA